MSLRMRRPSPGSRRQRPQHLQQDQDGISDSPLSTDWPQQTPRSTRSMKSQQSDVSFEQWGNLGDVNDDFDFNHFSFDFPNANRTNSREEAGSFVSDSSFRTSSQVGTRGRTDRMDMYRTSPDRASIGAVRRRREHAKQLARAIDGPSTQEGSTSGPQHIQQVRRREPSPRRQQPPQQPFWHSSNASIGSGSNGSAFNMGSILEGSELNEQTPDWPQQDFRGGYGDNASDFEHGPFSGMVIGKSKKKKSSSNKKKAKEAEAKAKAKQEVERKQQMKIMAEEAAARSRAAGHAPVTPTEFSAQFDFPDDDEASFDFNGHGEWSRKSNVAHKDFSTTTEWETNFSPQQHSQMQQGQSRDHQLYKVRQSNAPPWSQQHLSRKQASASKTPSEPERRGVNAQQTSSPRRTPSSTFTTPQTRTNVASTQRGDKSPRKQRSPRRPSPAPPVNQNNAMSDAGLRESSSRSSSNKTSLLKQRFAREQEKKRQQQQREQEHQQHQQGEEQQAEPQHSFETENSQDIRSEKHRPSSFSHGKEASGRQGVQDRPTYGLRPSTPENSFHHDTSSQQRMSAHSSQPQRQSAPSEQDFSDARSVKERWQDRETRSQSKLEPSPSRRASPRRSPSMRSSPTRNSDSSILQRTSENEEGMHSQTVVGKYANSNYVTDDDKTRQSTFSYSQNVVHDSGRASPILEGRMIVKGASLSPVDTTTSSLTGSTVDTHGANEARSNPFKEMAGFHATKKRNPAGSVGSNSSNIHRASSPVQRWENRNSASSEAADSSTATKSYAWSRERRASPFGGRSRSPVREEEQTRPTWMRHQETRGEEDSSVSTDDRQTRGSFHPAKATVSHFARSDPGIVKPDSPEARAAKASWRKRVAKQQHENRIAQSAAENQNREIQKYGDKSKVECEDPDSVDCTKLTPKSQEHISSTRTPAAPPWSSKRFSVSNRVPSDDQSLDSASKASSGGHNSADIPRQRPSWQEIVRERQKAKQQSGSSSEVGPDRESIPLQSSKSWQQKLKERQAAAKRQTTSFEGGDDDSCSVDSSNRARSDIVTGSMNRPVAGSSSVYTNNFNKATLRKSPQGSLPRSELNRSMSESSTETSNSFLSRVKLRKSPAGGLDDLLNNKTPTDKVSDATSNHDDTETFENKEGTKASQVENRHFRRVSSTITDPIPENDIQTPREDAEHDSHRRDQGSNKFHKEKTRPPNIDTSMLEELQSADVTQTICEDEITCSESLQATIEGGTSPTRSEDKRASAKDALNAAILRRGAGQGTSNKDALNAAIRRRGNRDDMSNRRESRTDVDADLKDNSIAKEESDEVPDAKAVKDVLNASLMKRFGNPSPPSTGSSDVKRKVVSENGVSPRDMLNAALLKRMAPTQASLPQCKNDGAESKETKSHSVVEETPSEPCYKQYRPTQQSTTHMTNSSATNPITKDLLNAAILRKAAAASSSQSDADRSATKDLLKAALMKRNAPSPSTVLDSQPDSESSQTETPPPTTPSILVPQNVDGPLAKYHKMLKIGMPMEVVRHAMTRDGINPDLLDGNDNAAVSTAPQPSANAHEDQEKPETANSNDPLGPVPLKKDPRYAKYFKMLKLGLPLEAAKHSMMRDGLDGSILDGDHDAPAPGSPSSNSAPALKDDPKYAKYFKMLKMGLPMDAVKHAMSRDGADPSIMDGDHSKPAKRGPNSPGSRSALAGGAAAAVRAAMGGSSPKNKQPAKPKDTVRRMRIHWNTMEQDSMPNNSVWALLHSDPEVDDLDIDETEFKELFQAEIKEKKATLRSDESHKKNVVKVIDAKRANNGGIILARIKMSFKEVADSIETLDEAALTAEQLQALIEYLPTNEEIASLKAYIGFQTDAKSDKINSLCECEKFMVAMMNVRFPKNKIRCLMFKQQFASIVEQLDNDATTVDTACDEILNSVRLRKLLGTVLSIGNKLNTAGSQKRKANAFTLESLLKLDQAKAFDKKTTVLHYIVLVVRRNNELLVRFADDLPSILKASKIYWDQCLGDLDEVENQLENVRKLALYEFNVARMKEKGLDVTTPPSLHVDDLSLDDELEALRSSKIGVFTLGAIKKVSALRDKVDMTRSKFKRVLEYFGESKKKIQPNELFDIFVTFCNNFKKANLEVIENEKKKAKEEKRKKETENSTNQKIENGDDNSSNKSSTKKVPAPTPPPPKKTESKPLRLSAMQPNMASVLKELQQSKRTAAAAVPQAPASRKEDDNDDDNSSRRRQESSTLSKDDQTTTTKSSTALDDVDTALVPATSMAPPNMASVLKELQSKRIAAARNNESSLRRSTESPPKSRITTTSSTLEPPATKYSTPPRPEKSFRNVNKGSSLSRSQSNDDISSPDHRTKVDLDDPAPTVVSDESATIDIEEVRRSKLVSNNANTSTTASSPIKRIDLNKIRNKSSTEAEPPKSPFALRARERHQQRSRENSLDASSSSRRREARDAESERPSNDTSSSSSSFSGTRTNRFRPSPIDTESTSSKSGDAMAGNTSRRPSIVSPIPPSQPQETEASNNDEELDVSEMASPSAVTTTTTTTTSTPSERTGDHRPPPRPRSTSNRMDSRIMKSKLARRRELRARNQN